jgi:Icc-related predicted phosphoesterase
MAVSDRIMEKLYRTDVAERHPTIDLIIGCGDLPFYYLDFLTSALDAQLIYVKGNHDQGPQYTANGRVLNGVPGGIDIHGRIVNLNGLLIGGLEGSMRYRPKASLMYSEREMSLIVGRLIPNLLWNMARYGRAVDILVTHSPPYNIHDKPDVAHQGFKVFRTIMKLFEPKYLLHGHIHVYRQDLPRETKFGDTTVINVYPLRILELDLKSSKSKK